MKKHLRKAYTGARWSFQIQWQSMVECQPRLLTKEVSSLLKLMVNEAPNNSFFFSFLFFLKFLNFFYNFISTHFITSTLSLCYCFFFFFLVLVLFLFLFLFLFCLLWVLGFANRSRTAGQSREGLAGCHVCNAGDEVHSRIKLV